MIFSYDSYKKLERPSVYLAKPDKTYIGSLKTYNLNTELCFNNISKATFRIYKYENKKLVPFYNDIEVMRLIEISYIGWFQITEAASIGDGANEYKEITALSLENELTTKILTSFGSMGVETDSQGGLDRYCLYSLTDTAHSILHVIMEMAPTWTVNYVDEAITKQYRTFKNDSVDAYSFLTNDVSKEFSCIFQFDTFTRSIFVYKLENIGELTGVYLSYRNLVKEITIRQNSSDIKTIMKVAGGDYEGKPLQITGINPSGNSTISNFSYYKPLFSDELRAKYEAYETMYKERSKDYSLALNQLNELILKQEDIMNRLPSTPHSTNWSEYGTIGLQTEADYYKQQMSLYLDGKNEVLRMRYYSILYGPLGIEVTQTIRKQELEHVKNQIAQQRLVCKNLTLNLYDFLGHEHYLELSNYAHYTDFVDDTYVATTNMTDSEVLAMQQDLFKMANEELNKICHPSYTMSVSTSNFAALPQFHMYAEQLILGNLVTVEFDNDETIESRLLKINIGWDDSSSFDLVFSSKNRLDEGWAEFSEIQSMAASSSMSNLINGTGYNKAKDLVTPITEYMKNAFNTSLQKLKNGKNEEFLVDATGTMWRKWVDERNDYSPNQMWGTSNGLFLSNTAWKSVETAIGELTIGTDENGNDVILYGIAAKLLLGLITMTEELYIVNENNSFTINKDGFLGSNGVNTIKITPNDPNGLFSIWKDDEKKALIYFDSEGNAFYKGNMTIGKIFSENYISSNGTLGSMLDLTNGTFQFANNRLRLDNEALLTLDTQNLSSTSISGGKVRCNRLKAGFQWMGKSFLDKNIVTDISEGFICLQYSGREQDIYITPGGISTTPAANLDSSGTIDFYSSIYGNRSSGEPYSGITVRTNGSPAALMSNASNVILNPNANDKKGMFVLSTNSEGNGQIKFGDFQSKTYHSGIVLHGDSKKGIKITDGNTGLGNLIVDELQAKSGTINGKKIATEDDIKRLENEMNRLVRDRDYYKGLYEDLLNSITKPPATT